MRLVGIIFKQVSWVAVERGTALHPLAPVEQFYADPERWLGAAHDAPAIEADQPYTPCVPVPRDAKVLCAGLNYRAHAAESRMALPSHPDVFGRWASTLVPSGTPVPVPAGEPGLDWEGELAVVIGRTLYNATPDEVTAAVIAYTCFNDLSARTHQLNSSQWTIGKNADASGPMGPALVTREDIPDPYALRLRTLVDGEVVQEAPTSQMIFTIGQIGAYASECMTLRPGDVIVTGTPEGIGATRKPPRFLGVGQVVEVEIEGIGTLTTPIQGTPARVTAEGEPVASVGGAFRATAR